MTNEQYTVERFLEYVRKSRSKNTLVMYREGLKRFAEWYGKSPNEILEERRQDWKSDDLFRKRRFAREIEEFHGYLVKEKGYAASSATYYCQGIRSLFAYFEMPLKVSAEIDKRRVTTRDYVPRIDQYAEMFKVADNLRDKLVVSMGITLGWRIGDFAKIKKSDIPSLDQEAPIPFEAITEKEDVVAKSFLADEIVELLREYLPTLPENNVYLFPSNGKEHLDHTTFNRVVRELADKAKIKIPKRKRIRFHCFRKRFLSECANLRVDVNMAKLMTGKAVEASMLAYLSEIDLRDAFRKISERLRLSEKKPSASTTKEPSELRREIDQLRKLVHGIAALHGDNIVKDAAEKLDISMHDVYARYPSIEKILEAVAEKEWQKQRKEYDQLIAENNNSH